MPPLQKAFQMPSIWLRSSPVSTEAAVVPGAMEGWGVVAAAPLPLRRPRPLPEGRCSPWRRAEAWRLQATAGAAGFFGGAHGHHMILGGFELLVAEGIIGQIQQLGAQLCVAHAVSVLRDQGQQGVGEVGTDGHREPGAKTGDGGAAAPCGRSLAKLRDPAMVGSSGAAWGRSRAKNRGLRRAGQPWTSFFAREPLPPVAGFASVG